MICGKNTRQGSITRVLPEENRQNEMNARAQTAWGTP